MIDEIQVKDRKAIEEKALLCFKEYIVDSKIISQFIPENDKEPFWDGYLYLYSNPQKTKECFVGRIPTQVKGTEVKRFEQKKYKFKIDMVDLKAYLHEPTLFIVCQEKENSKERKLFYRCLLPETVKSIIRGHDKQDSVKVLMHPIPENLLEFEGIALVFLTDSNKQISFINAKPLTIEDVKSRGIRNFSVITPAQKMNRLQLLKYLSTHESFLYAEINKEFNVDIPISGGPMSFTFKQEVNGNISVDGKVFFDSYSTEIKNGRIIVSVGNFLSVNMPMDEDDKTKIKMKLQSSAIFLNDAIKEIQFALAMNEAGKLSIGNVNLEVKLKDNDFIQELKEQLKRWEDLQRLLDQLHVTKPLNISNLTKEEERLLGILVTTIIYGKPVKLQKQESKIIIAEISNVTLLLWCNVDKEDMCMFGDFFDHFISLYKETSEGTNVEACCYSYLCNDRLWEKCNNIPFDDVLPSYLAIAGNNKYVYEMANYDVLAMINASDSIESEDFERSRTLLKTALLINDWLYCNDKSQNAQPIHLTNKMQIIKRQRYLSDAERGTLFTLVHDENVSSFVKVGCLLLLDDIERAKSIYLNLTTEEQQKIKDFPIWKFAN